MTNSETSGSPKWILHADLATMTELEQAELLDRIIRLQETLCRFIPLLNSQSIEIVTRSRVVVEKIGGEVQQALSIQRFQNRREQLERWDNEGGRTNYVAE